MSRVVVDAEGDEVEQRLVAPRRLRLPASAVDRLGELGDVPSPAARLATISAAVESLAGRLGGDAAAPNAAGATPSTDIDALLSEEGLVDAGVLTATGRAVLDVWHRPVVAVELEMLLETRRGTMRVRSRHCQLGHWVVCLSTADARTFELAWLVVDDWWLELGRVAVVDRSRSPARDEVVDPLPDVVETPWELLVATGEALAHHRDGLVARLVGDHTGCTTAGAATDALVPAVDSDVRSWHEVLGRTSRGRLHVLVLGCSERGRPCAGIVEWVLLPDGWRSLTAVRRDGTDLVRIERRGPQDLGRDLAVLAAQVTT